MPLRLLVAVIAVVTAISTMVVNRGDGINFLQPSSVALRGSFLAGGDLAVKLYASRGRRLPVWELAVAGGIVSRAAHDCLIDAAPLASQQATREGSPLVILLFGLSTVAVVPLSSLSV